MRLPARTLPLVIALSCTGLTLVSAQQTQKPPLHAKHWLAITGKPLAATAGALTFA
jgi:gamma-glutamyltranspeptidase/glutathione hydrolase